jgi:formylglycine-generating enzyme required for sulfatase activity
MLFLLPALTRAASEARCPQSEPLSETQLSKLVKGSVPGGRIGHLVASCGIDFEPTEDAVGRLRLAGAPESVLAAVRAAWKPVLVAGPKMVNPTDGLPYVWAPPGKFMMGCSPGDAACFNDEKPAHEVTITKGFWMGQTEVTQEAYERVRGNNPSRFKGARLPVEMVSWFDAQSHCQAVGMRLPTEAEWEYAARGGSTGGRYGDVYRVAWYLDNSGRETHEVGGKQPNAWGSYDMLGNVWEWVADWYADTYPAGSQRDPGGPASGALRVLRGGSVDETLPYVRASFRGAATPESSSSTVGFRCAGD